MRVKIHEHTDQKRIFQKELDAVQNDFKALKELCSQYIEIEDLELFYADAASYFLDVFQNLHSKTFPMVSGVKLCELLEVPLERIKTLSERIVKAKIKIAPDTLKPIDKPDFNVYATTEEQIARFNIAKRVCDMYVEASKYATCYPSPFSTGTSGMVTPDFEKRGYVKPNYRWVLNLPNRTF